MKSKTSLVLSTTFGVVLVCFVINGFFGSSNVTASEPPCASVEVAPTFDQGVTRRHTYTLTSDGGLNQSPCSRTLTTTPSRTPSGSTIVKLLKQTSIDDLRKKAKTDGTVAIIVNLAKRSDLRSLDKYDPLERAFMSQRRNLIAKSLLDDGASVKEHSLYWSSPGFAAIVTSRQLDELISNPNVESVVEDFEVELLSNDVGKITGANLAWARGYSGKGYSVAVLDSGVERDHPLLSGKVIGEACYSTNNPNRGLVSLCRGRMGSDYGIGSSSPKGCLANAIQICFHGTNVSGTAVGRYRQFSGVARDSNLVSIQVLSAISQGGYTIVWSDVVGALNYVRSTAVELNIAAVNLSFGQVFGDGFQNECRLFEQQVTTVILQLKAMSIPTIAATGNEGFLNAEMYPACIPDTISVTASSKADVVSTFSSISANTDFVAPGEDVITAILDGRYSQISGTSLAAPVVAGAWTVVRQFLDQRNAANPGQPVSTSVDDIQLRLYNSAKPVDDTRPGALYTVANGNAKRRISLATIGQIGNGPLELSHPNNDNYQNATSISLPLKPPLFTQREVPIDGLSYSQFVTQATQQSNEPNVSVGQLPYHSVWYKLNSASSSVPVRVDTLGSDYDTLLSVYTLNGSTFTPVTLIISNNDANIIPRLIPPQAPGVDDTTLYAVTSEVEFTTQPNIDYYIRITSVRVLRPPNQHLLRINIHRTGYRANRDAIGLYNVNTFTVTNSNLPADAFNTVFGPDNYTPLIGDWNGDTITDIGVYRDGMFTLKRNNIAGNYEANNYYVTALGFESVNGVAAYWKPIVGDWDGNGTDTIGLYFNPAEALGAGPTPSVLTGEFRLSNDNRTLAGRYTFTTASGSLTPLTGDWEGDGIDSVGVFVKKQFVLARGLPTLVTSTVVPTYTPAVSTPFTPTNTPFTPVSTITAVPLSTGTVSSYGAGIPHPTVGAGTPTPTSYWKPITGDWNGDGKDDVGLYAADGSGEYIFSVDGSNTYGSANFGSGIYQPVIGNWNGDYADALTPTPTQTRRCTIDC